MESTPRGASFFGLRFWLVATLTGIGAGLGGAALMALLRVVQHTAWAYGSGSFLDAVTQASPAHRVLVLASAGVVAAAGLLGLRKFAAAGPELWTAIWFYSGRVPLVRTIGNAVLSILIVGLGASLGREAAPKDLGGAVASGLSERFGLPPGQRRLLVACGAGAGMAAVYNVPLGGALFALEVLLGTLALPLVVPALATSLLATAVAWIALPRSATFSVSSSAPEWSTVAWALAFGPLAGVASVLFVRAIAWASAHKPQGNRTLPVTVAVFTLLGVASIAYPQILGNGIGVVRLAFADRFGVALMAVLLIAKLAATAGCIGTGAPGGLLMPTMSFGALLGGLLGYFWELAWPAHQPGTYALIGSAAVLAATTQAPLSALVLVLELTRNANGALVPLMLAVAGAALAARALDSRSIYSARASRDARTERVSREYGALAAAEPYAKVLERRLAFPHRPLYVVDDAGRLAGEISGADISAAGGWGAGLPLALTVAGDLARPTALVDTDMSETEVWERLCVLRAEELPLVERASGRLVGIVRRDALERSRA